MKYMLQAAGMLIILSSVWLRAVRRLTINFAAFWGTAGILLVAAGMVLPPYGWIAAPDAGREQLLYFFGAVILTGGYIISLRFSYLTMKNQEQAIRLSLLSQEKDEKIS